MPDLKNNPRLPVFFAQTTAALVLFLFFCSSWAMPSRFENRPTEQLLNLTSPEDTTRRDSTQLHYPFNDRPADAYNSHYPQSGLYLSDPSNINSTIEYNPVEKQYDITERIGQMYYRNPSYLTFEEFKEREFNQSTRKYWRQRAGEDDILLKKSFNPKIYVGSDVFDRIFGGNTIDIRPQGSAELRFGLNIQNRQNPAIPEKQRTTTTFDFSESINMSVIGNIGEKMRIGVNYNTEASFEFENKMKLEYTGKEDEIIQKIEAGNVSLPLTGSLIQGSQSLFGLKTQLKFGRMRVTSVLSQQKGQRSTINVPPGGGQVQNFEILADQYEANKHFFLCQYFKDNYDKALKTMPYVNSPFTITKLEVWKTNRSARTESNRDVVAFMDLGEYNYYANGFIGQGTSVYPSDSLSNDLYYKMTQVFPYKGIRDPNQASSILGALGIPPTNFAAQQDYVVIRNAVKLTENEYTFNPQLGFISLNSSLNPDEELAIAFEYTISGNVFRVGELTNSGVDPTQSLIVKLIRSRAVSPKLPTWDLMMKNVYSLNGYQVQKENFKLQVYYADDADGGKKKRFLNAGPTEQTVSETPLLRLLNLDNLNTNNDPVREGDGVFDFVPGITINTANGRIYFPVREPFGQYLESRFNDPANGKKFSYPELYDSTITVAQQFASKNKFSISGSYQSASGAEISLNAINIPQGAVVVTAAGQTLTENQDYTVDYNLGRVKIINAGLLASNTPIQVSVESQSLFSIQSKTLIGSRFDYEVSKDLTFGGTFLHLNERPLTQKVNVGDEPISNTIWGLDGTYRTESRFLTKLVDKLPFLETKEQSTITFSGEFAQFIPGHSSAIGSSGNAYIDDFEGSQSTIDIRQPGQWFLASTPLGQPTEFPETQGAYKDSLHYGYNRARLSWYQIDPTVFYRDNQSLLPPNITAADLSNNNVRAVREKEIFPNKENPNNVDLELPVLDLGFYPEERGPYNFVTDDVPGIGISGLSADGKLKNPQSRWGGMMRRIETSDFEFSNVEYIQFWIMNPFHGENINSNTGGKLFFDLGSISEDILRDGNQFFENGLPTPQQPNLSVDTSIWGRYPLTDDITKAFINDNTNANEGRKAQDLGYDGFTSAEEASFRADYLARLNSVVTNNSAFVQETSSDPSNDDFHYFRGSDYDSRNLGILERYKKWNGTEGNSNPDSPEGYPIAATTIPDNEDINRDYQTDKDENYNQYEVDFDPTNLISNKYLVDSIQSYASTPDKLGRTVTWYQFRIPIRKPDQVIGLGANLKAVNFVRMFLKGWSNPVILRFAKLELLRGEWRRYPYSLEQEGSQQDIDAFPFNVSVVNIEENGKRQPVNYVIPPGIEREIAVGTTNQQRLNEQSLSMQVCDLPEGGERAAYKTTQFDVRNYKKIKMFIHAEDRSAVDQLADKEAVAFIRLGTDFSNNYYEYEIPLKVTRWFTTASSGIWPDENQLEINIDELTNLKLERNDNQVAYNVRYSKFTGQNRISVKGNPSLSNVKTLMLGIRNYAQGNNPFLTDDSGNKLCVEVWFNELRMSDFNEEGGWAANARIQTKLADFGNVTLSGSRSTYGFGQLESKINERQQDNRTQYDIATSLELGKFLPQKTGVSVPMYIGYGQTIARPEYDPLNPDIRLEQSLDVQPTNEARDKLKNLTEDFTKRKSINFTNVRKNRTDNKKKPKVYDVENFNVSYGYSETYRRNVNTEYDMMKDYTGSIGYNFNTNAKGLSPFSKSKGLKSKYAKPIKDFNVNFIPSNFSFRTDVTRHYQEVKLRNINDELYAPPATFDKRFLMGRQYTLNWDLTKSIKIDFDANNQARIDEPEGALDTKQKRDSMWSNFFRLGRNTDYRQSGNISYNVPLNKLPITDWISVNTRYGFNYHWSASPLVYDPVSLEPRINPAIGNTIENSNNKQVNSTLNFTTLYNKVPLLKKLLGPVPPKPKTPPKPPEPPKNPQDTTKGKKPNLPKEKKEKQYGPVPRAIAKIIFSVKNFSVGYTETRGTLLPGYTRTSEIFGNNFYSDANGKQTNAPGFGFVFGRQDPDFKFRAARNGWVTDDSTLNQQFTNTLTQNLTLRSSIEPLTGLKIDLNGNRNFAKNHTEYFRTGSNGEFNVFNAVDAGNFSISWLTINTAFTKDNDDYTNEIFKKFDQNRRTLSRRLAAQNALSSGLVNDSGYVDGYGATSQEVLTYAFIAAYSGNDAEAIGIKNPFPKTPKPNWRVQYDGLSKLPLMKKLFQNITLTHGYRSSLNIASYSTSLLYKPDGSARNQAGDFIPVYELQQISITEQFTPLLGVDVTWKNKVSTRVEYKKDRSVSLSYAGVQITEVKGNEITVGAGYRFKPKFPLKIGGKKILLNNDMNLTADVSYRRNSTILRKLQEGINQPTAGLSKFSYSMAADYNVNERLNVKASFIRDSQVPLVSTSFPITITKFEIAIRFTLAQ